MHILLTGGTGFIGHALCVALLASGHRLSVLSREPLRAREHLPAAVTVVGNLRDIGCGVDAVFNLAGANLTSGRWTEARKRRFRHSRIDLTHRLVQWMRLQPQVPRVLISGSAIGWYGDRGDQWLDEAAAPADDFAAQLCRDWEQAAMSAAELGVRVCTVRTGIVLGPGGGALKAMLPAFRLGLGGPIGSGRQYMSWISLEDEVSLLCWLLARDEAFGAFNATAPAPIRQREFAAMLGQQLHRPAVLPMPTPLLQLLFGEMSSLLLGSQRVDPRRALEAGFRFRHRDVSDALAAALAP